MLQNHWNSIILMELIKFKSGIFGSISYEYYFFRHRFSLIALLVDDFLDHFHSAHTLTHTQQDEHK